jgi:pimeloyl-ACP methyl ester carboxylesterase
MTHVSDNGTRIWYEVTGDGPPLVLTGGWGLLDAQWHGVRPLLAKEFKCIDWNTRGCGKSDRGWPGGFPLDRWVDDLAVVLDHLGYDGGENKVHLWATSTGSMLAIRFAARYPERVASLITFPMFVVAPASRQKAATYLALAENFGYQALARFTQWIGCADQYVYGAKGDEIAKFEAGVFAENFSIAAISKIMDAYYTCDLSADVAKLTMPVMLYMGSSGQNGADKLKPAVDSFLDLCPSAELKIMPNLGGTYLMVEEPETAAPPVIEWVKRHS